MVRWFELLNGVALAIVALVTVTLVTVALATTDTAFAQRPGADKASGAANDSGKAKPTREVDPAKVRRQMAVTPEREAAARTFVQQHHPELDELLLHLKTSQKKLYQAAVRDLFRTSERLANVRANDPNRYELELTNWKVRSRIQLLVARLQMTPDDEPLRKQLGKSLQQQADAQRKVLQYERKRLQIRLEKIDQQIKRLQTNQANVDRQIDNLLRRPARPSVRKTEPVKKPRPATSNQK